MRNPMGWVVQRKSLSTKGIEALCNCLSGAVTGSDGWVAGCNRP